MPMVIRHNGVLNDITAGLAEGVSKGAELAAQAEAIKAARQRRELELRNQGFAESDRMREQGFEDADRAYQEGQRKYRGLTQQQEQEDRARRLEQDKAAQEANAYGANSFGNEPSVPGDDARIQGPVAPPTSSFFSDADRAHMDEVAAIARHMDPERGRQFVQDQHKQLLERRSKEYIPRLIDAWTQSMQPSTDPNGAVMAPDPKIAARAQTNIQGLQAGVIDPETSLQHFQAQQADVAARRQQARLKTTYQQAIDNRIARMQEVALTHPELEQDLLDRIDEAQTYRDMIGDPSVLEDSDVRGNYTRAMAALHGRGSSGSSVKKQRSLYSEARALAQKDVSAMLLTGDKAAQALDAMTERHLAKLQAEQEPPSGRRGSGWGKEGGGMSGATPSPEAGGIPKGGPAGPPDFATMPVEEIAKLQPAEKQQALNTRQELLVRKRRAIDQLPEGPEKEAAMKAVRDEAASLLSAAGIDPTAPIDAPEPKPVDVKRGMIPESKVNWPGGG